MKSTKKLSALTLVICIFLSAVIIFPMQAFASSSQEVVVVGDGNNGTKVIRELYKPEITVNVGENPTSKLPADIAVIYEDGSTARVPVTWNPISPNQYSTDGEFYVDGILTGVGTNLIPQCKVIVGSGISNNPTTTTTTTAPTTTTTAPTTTTTIVTTTTVYNIDDEGKSDVETADIAVVWICTVLIIFLISSFVAAGIWKMWKARHQSAELTDAIGAAAARRDSSDKRRRK